MLNICSISVKSASQITSQVHLSLFFQQGIISHDEDNQMLHLSS